ncbi:MAG: valine--tRNA ligase [Promethearchaeota archaeon]|nr:MAG: valine--tRNA ligase [Candidatus Lokiarchaeota archaeon]
MTQASIFPKRFNFTKVQKKWIDFWQKEKIFKFDITENRRLLSMDTPPPFVSGTLHMGHILNHSWIDFVARYRRMKGSNVYFPQGFDCHGLPVELAVTKNYGISKHDRDEFLKKCIEWVEMNIKNMTSQLNVLGYSTDWTYTYRTMDDHYKKKVQISLLEFFEKGLLYRAKFPTHFCVNCETSVAKAEVGYRDELGKLWYIKLALADRNDDFITIATTRPEYMEACVGVLINPNDQRYLDLSAAKVKLPIADRIVPIYMDPEVDMNFGTGIVYVCTYGDEMDIKWKLKYDLDEIQIFTEDGKMNANSKYQGLKISEARDAIVNDLEEMGLIEKAEDYEHSVIIHSERSSCRRPIEYLPVDQWFINLKDYSGEIIDSAESMKWYPEKHKQRLIDWATGLDWNWVISRQRVFGTPIPFWYCKDCGYIIAPRREDLPIDPVKNAPPIKKCPECNSDSIVPEKDVCDCWIDSSITPLIISKWLDDEDFYKKIYLDAEMHRPQGYEIIRTWMFYTLFRCRVLTGKVPFTEAMINGMVAGPDGRHMSKSYGNIVSPDEVMPDFGTDVVRQWAAMGSLGEDYPFEFTWINKQSKQPVSNEKILAEQKRLPVSKFNNKYGRNFEQLIGASRFLTKMWNAYRFLYINATEAELPNLEVNISDLTEIESYFFDKFNQKLREITDYFDQYNWHEGFMLLRSFFWEDLCDNYIEAIKFRFYSEDVEIKTDAIRNALNLFYKVLKTFSFIMPFICEEIHEILYKNYYPIKSLFFEVWAQPYQTISSEDIEKGLLIIQIIRILRNLKSTLQIPLNQEISRIVISTESSTLLQLDQLIDIKETLRIRDFEVIDSSSEFKPYKKVDYSEKNIELESNIFIIK